MVATLTHTDRLTMVDTLTKGGDGTIHTLVVAAVVLEREGNGDGNGRTRLTKNRLAKL